MHYVLGIASVSLCWSRQSWARPTDHHQEEETEELGQQRQQQRGHHRRQETQPRHQLQPLQSGTCKHQLHSVCLLFLYLFIFLKLFFTSSLSPHACLQGWTKAWDIPSGTAAVNLFFLKKKRERERRGEGNIMEHEPLQRDKETSRDLFKHFALKKRDKRRHNRKRHKQHWN